MSGTRGLQTKNAPDWVKSGTLHLNILPPEFARTESTRIIQAMEWHEGAITLRTIDQCSVSLTAFRRIFQLVLLDEHCDRRFFHWLTPHLSPASEPR
jgi:hypothetical protein